MAEATIFSAADKGDLRQLQKFVDKGIDINERESNDLGRRGRTALIYATLSNRIDAVKFLLSKGAKPNLSSNDGWTPIYWAAYYGHGEIVRLLGSAGADPNIPNDEGWTPLHAAVYNGHDAAIRVLIHLKADVNAMNKDGNTPLHIGLTDGAAALSSSLKLLIAAKSNVLLLNFYDQSALDLAREKDFADCVALLEQANSNTLTVSNVNLLRAHDDADGFTTRTNSTTSTQRLPSNILRHHRGSEVSLPNVANHSISSTSTYVDERSPLLALQNKPGADEPVTSAAAARHLTPPTTPPNAKLAAIPTQVHHPVISKESVFPPLGTEPEMNVSIQADDVVVRIPESPRRKNSSKSKRNDKSPLMSDHDDDDDDDDDDNDGRKNTTELKREQPSAWKQILVILLAAVATILTLYYLPGAPIVSVSFATLLGATVKSAVRVVNPILRYALLSSLCAAGWVADFYLPINLQLGPLTTTVLVAVSSRVAKNWILGKPPFR